MSVMITAATEEQMNTEHAYEDEFQRWLAWTFENIFRAFEFRANSPDEFGNMVHNYGQAQINHRNRSVAHAWAKFAARKYIDTLNLETA